MRPILSQFYRPPIQVPIQLTNENADFKTNPPGSTLKNSEEEEDGESSSDEEEDAIDSQDSRIQQPSDNKTLPQDVPSPHMPPSNPSRMISAEDTVYPRLQNQQFLSMMYRHYTLCPHLS
jgi:hypothetical protein